MDKKVVRASYESCLDITARLAAYVTSSPLLEAIEVNKRQDILAEDDLIVFCIYARRLVENAGLGKLLNQTTMKTSDGTSLSLWKIIGYLIHHDLLIILRCETRFRMLQASLEGASKDEFFKKVEGEMKKSPYSEPIQPHVLFKSDIIHYTLINLVEFLQIFSQEIIPKIIKKALDEDLYLLDDPLRDLDISEEGLRALSRIRGLNSPRKSA